MRTINFNSNGNLKMNEEEFLVTYKYYTKEMLERLDMSKFTDQQKALIAKLISDKSPNKEVIFDGGNKDKLIIALRWNLILVSMSIAINLITSKNKLYGFRWFDVFSFYTLTIGVGFAVAIVLYIFFTNKFRGKIISTWKYCSFACAIIMMIGEWNLCRLSYVC